MLDSIYNMTLKVPIKSHVYVKTLTFCHYVCNVVMSFIT